MPGNRAAGDGLGIDGAVEDPNAYKQSRRIQELFDARQRVLDQRRKALDMLYMGELGGGTAADVPPRDMACILVHNAVEDYLLESEQAIRNHKHSQWYWQGEPPTTDGQPPSFWSSDEDSDESDGDGSTTATVPLAETNLVLEDGRTPFGVKPLLLGSIDIDAHDETVHFRGLSDFMDFGSSVSVEIEETTTHPEKLLETETHEETYVVPMEISMEAYRTVNEFWASVGLEVDFDEGLPVQKQFDQSRETDRDSRVDHVKQEGRPEL